MTVLIESAIQSHDKNIGVTARRFRGIAADRIRSTNPRQEILVLTPAIPGDGQHQRRHHRHCPARDQPPPASTAASRATPGGPTVPATTVPGPDLRPSGTPRGGHRGALDVKPRRERRPPPAITPCRTSPWSRIGENQTSGGQLPPGTQRVTRTVTAGMPAVTRASVSTSHTTPCACGHRTLRASSRELLEDRITRHQPPPNAGFRLSARTIPGSRAGWRRCDPCAVGAGGWRA